MKITKRKITLACSALAVIISGMTAFISDIADGFHESGIVETAESKTEQSVQQIVAFSETLGSTVQEAGENFQYDYPSEYADISGRDTCTMTKVTDGDTYHVERNGEDITVRLIGVDTPESVAPESYRKENTDEGRKVSDIVKEKIQIGDTVYLEYDVSETDRYGRTLAYMYFSDGTMVQDWLLTNGYATVFEPIAKP